MVDRSTKAGEKDPVMIKNEVHSTLCDKRGTVIFLPLPGKKRATDNVYKELSRYFIKNAKETFKTFSDDFLEYLIQNVDIIVPFTSDMTSFDII